MSIGLYQTNFGPPDDVVLVKMYAAAADDDVRVRVKGATVIAGVVVVVYQQSICLEKVDCIAGNIIEACICSIVSLHHKRGFSKNVC